MRTQTGRMALPELIPASTATRLITNIMVTDDPTMLRQHLKAMMESYLLSEDEAKYRHEVFSSYMSLDNLLEKIETEYRKERRVA